jgi:hypothetical protein
MASIHSVFSSDSLHERIQFIALVTNHHHAGHYAEFGRRILANHRASYYLQAGN